MLFRDYMDYMFCYTVNKFFNFSKKFLKKHLQFVMQLIIEENDLIFCYLIKYIIWILLFTPKIAFVITIFLCILNQIIFYIFNCIHFLNHFYLIFNFLASACFNDCRCLFCMLDIFHCFTATRSPCNNIKPVLDWCIRIEIFYGITFQLDH